MERVLEMGGRARGENGGWWERGGANCGDDGMGGAGERGEGCTGDEMGG